MRINPGSPAPSSSGSHSADAAIIGRRPEGRGPDYVAEMHGRPYAIAPRRPVVDRRMELVSEATTHRIEE